MSLVQQGYAARLVCPLLDFPRCQLLSLIHISEPTRPY